MVPCGFECLWYGQIDRLGAREFAVGPRGVEMHVVGDHVTFLAHDGKENALSRPSLVSGNDMLETCNGLNRLDETPKTGRPSVGFIATHHRRPLLSRHCPRTGIREEVNENVFGRYKEKIEPCVFQELLALLARGSPYPLHRFDAKWFWNRFHGHKSYR